MHETNKNLKESGGFAISGLEGFQGYKVTELVFRSNSTEIYRALNENNTQVILKVLREAYIGSEKLANFRKEFDISSKLDSKWVVKAYKLEEYSDSLFMELEDFGGTSLSNYIENEAADVDTEQLKKRLEIAIEIVKAINVIHGKNIIHRDINPSNIVFNKYTGTVKIIDFGLATELEREYYNSNHETIFAGTYAYIAPEQVGWFNRTIDYRADYYSLGVTLYELFSTKQPFTGNSPREWIHCHLAKEPLPLNKLNEKIPEQLSFIVMKLMNKAAENRYQSEYGIQKDLEACLTDLERYGDVRNFSIANHDISQKFILPQKLYGREEEVADLMNSYRELTDQKQACVLVSGASGIGKTSIVFELQRLVVKNGGNFIFGKFDQLKRNIPYSAFLPSLTQLVKSVLTERESEILVWKKKILENVKGNARLMVNVVPELEYIVGEQPEVSELPAAESQNRFFNTFLNFIKTFATQEQPLVLFLDDLHWADVASVEMVEHLLLNKGIAYFFFIGAYREKEMATFYPFVHSLKKMEQAGVNIKKMYVKALNQESVIELLTDTLSLTYGNAEKLAEICLKKTDGNPFFLREFLKNFYNKKQIYFNNGTGTWELDLHGISKSDVAENVAGLISKRITELPGEIQFVLKLAACIGSRFNAFLLKKITNLLWKELLQYLKEASEESLIYPLTEGYRYAEYNEKIDVQYKFAHDRVQQEIYSLLDEKDRNQIHKQIGEYILAGVDLNNLDNEEIIYTILEHLNKGMDYLRKEKQFLLAELNLRAGKESKKAGAFGHALHFFGNAARLIDNSTWQTNYNLAYQIHVQNAEALALCGKYDEMEKCINASVDNTKHIIEKVSFFEIRILALIAQHRQPEAVSRAITLLKLLGQKFPKHPRLYHIAINFIHIRRKLKKRSKGAQLELSVMQDEKALASMNVMAKILSGSYYVNPNLFALLVFRLIENTLKYGIAPNSPVALVTYGLLLYSLERRKEGYFNSCLGLKMTENIKAGEYQAQAICIHNSGVIWNEPLSDAVEGLYKAYRLGLDSGDVEYAGSSISAALTYKFYSGKNLGDLFVEALGYQGTLSYFELKVPLSQINVLLQTLDNLINAGEEKEILVGEYYNEDEMLQHFIAVDDKVSASNLYTKKMLLAFLFEETEKAYEISLKGREFIKESKGIYQTVVFHFYESLIFLKHVSKITSSVKRRAVERRIEKNRKKFRKWMKGYPGNFENKYLLIEAEVAKRKGKSLKAADLYEEAILLAKKNGFLGEQALAYELAGLFWLSQGKKEFSKIYLEKAYRLYNVWGALAKAMNLRSKFDQIISLEERIDDNGRRSSINSDASTTMSYTSSLDLMTILDASKAISGEIIYSELVKKTLVILLEHAGAERGVLLLKSQDKEMSIEASGKVDNDKIDVVVENREINSSSLPTSIIHYVEKTKDTVILDDAENDGDFTQDDYIRRNKVKSLVSIPILHQSKFSGILYLENNLNRNVFNQNRLNVLKVLCTQTAVSLENARLYNSMEQKVDERTREITEKKLLLEKQKEKIEQARDQLTELNATKDKFFSIIAHDLRGPLGNINSFFEILTEMIEEDDVKDTIRIINRFKATSKKTYDLLNNLLIWAQTQRNELEFTPRHQSVKDLIEANVLFVEHRANAKGVTMIDEVAKGTKAFFDRNLIETVIRNLIDNALKYVKNGDRVILSSEDQGTRIIISVRDTGVGMTREVSDNLFAIAKKRSSMPGTSGESGTGLGLILCKEFVGKNGGDIWVDSTLGKGSTFSFSLPKYDLKGAAQNI